ncbi:DUF4231 domain-containing protein [Frigidibacter sp.]|uniref:DUF4231 domain-containing protein n=1 Tax=Frigidibacter sp. TaxID=2586418 RepID=UPI0027359CF3|nr:DUF4231 domain-containing protein [Frigidibacter sp.]MDP3340775.1 DUF4231 domain-containing protein [Frigidibacter sp.]
MSGSKLEYPALYTSADCASARAQSGFLWTIRTEYFLLFLVSLSLANKDVFKHSRLAVTLLLMVLAGLFVYKVVVKLDQDWYRCRALSESVKTLTWRFCMRAHPFGDADLIAVPKAAFRNQLRGILQSNQAIARELITPESEQVSASMLKVRAFGLTERIAYYVEQRVDDQRRWYTKKSAWNRRVLRIWVLITILIYIAAALSLYADEFGYGWLSRFFDPLIVLVTSVLGWIQMKRHSELTASYNLAAHEIGIIKGNAETVMTEAEFSDFVNEAELAFSREHTQWGARKDAN